LARPVWLALVDRVWMAVPLALATPLAVDQYTV
jgi:hypothetical protein